jgi:hypothetical protein
MSSTRPTAASRPARAKLRTAFAVVVRDAGDMLDDRNLEFLTSA